MSKKNLAGLLAIPLVTIMLITGCTSPGPNTTEPPSPSPSISAPADPTESPAPEETSPPLVVENLEVGAPLTAEQAKELNGKRGTLRPYEQNDGSFIVIDVKQPLPEPVKQEVSENLGSVGNDTGSALSKLNQETSTGKTIIMVRQLQMGDGNGNAVFGWAAASYANGFPGFQGGSAESVAAQAQAWANTTRDPAQYEVIIVWN